MNQHIVIIGSGFAGLWSALSAARLLVQHQREDITVTMLAPQPVLTMRPRLYEANPAALDFPLSRLLEACGVRFIGGAATKIDTQNQCIHYLPSAEKIEKTLPFTRVILASGSVLNRNNIPGAQEFAFDINDIDSARRLEDHLHTLAAQPASPGRDTVVICGGGLTGVELALELPSRLRKLFGEQALPRIIVVDSGKRIGAAFSEELGNIIATASQCQSVEWRSECRVTHIDSHGVELSDGSNIACFTSVITAGVNASPLAGQINAKRDAQGRLFVNDMLCVEGESSVYAAGDIAHAHCDDSGHTALMSCQHAIPMGKFAGYNAVASLLHISPLPYRQPDYVTCVDLGEWGAVYTETWQQRVCMTRQEAKQLKQTITHAFLPALHPSLYP